MMSNGAHNTMFAEEVERMARKGLRTLVFGMKQLDRVADYDKLTAKDVEFGLLLIGVSGVEDLLQEGVKSCIEDFRDAGIKVWMLTGDKGTTA
jgi:P-type E1-E2 ATPase